MMMLARESETNPAALMDWTPAALSVLGQLGG